MGVDPKAPVGFQTLESVIRLQVADGADRDAVRRMLIEAESRSVVLATLRRAVPIHIRVWSRRPRRRRSRREERDPP